MITASHAARLSPPSLDWRALWREAVTDPRELLDMVGLGHLADRLPAEDAGFAVRVPRGFVARMRHGDPQDPLLLQALPQLAEMDQVPGYSVDAVGDDGVKSNAYRPPTPNFQCSEMCQS